jgi:O-antigen/teichoic acid export membrane protein
VTAALGRLRHRLAAGRVAIHNAASLVATTAVTSGLGFVFWWLAARLYPAAEVGLAAAAIAATTLLATLSCLGLGTLLIAELARAPERAASLLLTALAAVGLVGGALGAGYALWAAAAIPEQRALAGGPLGVTAFAVGVAAIAAAMIFDQAVVGLLRSDLQLWRNGLMSLLKLALLALGPALAVGGALAVYGANALGFALSFAGVWLAEALRGRPPALHAPLDWGLARRLGRPALEHHLLNLTLAAPILMLPSLLAAVLSPASAGHFYVAWMVANLLFAVPTALASVLHAVGAAAPLALARKLRLSLAGSLAVGGAGAAALALAAGPLLGLFGAEYAAEARACLQLLALSVIPLTFRIHYVAICRVRGRLLPATLVLAVGGGLELWLALAGARAWGLGGMAAGWLLALCAQLTMMAPTLLLAAFPPRPRPLPAAPAE